MLKWDHLTLIRNLHSHCACLTAQGFGFIDMGGVTVFVHHSQCEAGKQPKVGDVLTFSLEPRRFPWIGMIRHVCTNMGTIWVRFFFC